MKYLTSHAQGKQGARKSDKVNNYALSALLSRAAHSKTPGQACSLYVQLGEGATRLSCALACIVDCGIVEFSKGIVFVRESV